MKGDETMFIDKARYLAAAMAGVAAVIYLLIGAGVLQVVDGDQSGMATFGFAAASGFVLGVILLLAWKHPLVWVLGALLQIIVIVMYFAVGPDRTPHYEVWGLALRIPQVLILASLVYLTVVRRTPARGKEHLAR